MGTWIFHPGGLSCSSKVIIKLFFIISLLQALRQQRAVRHLGRRGVSQSGNWTLPYSEILRIQAEGRALQPPVVWGPITGAVLPDVSAIPMETGLRQHSSTFATSDEAAGYAVPRESGKTKKISAATPMRTRAVVHQKPAVETLKVPQFLANENVVPPTLPLKAKAFSAKKESEERKEEKAKPTLLGIARAVSAPPDALPLPRLTPSKPQNFSFSKIQLSRIFQFVLVR